MRRFGVVFLLVALGAGAYWYFGRGAQQGGFTLPGASPARNAETMTVLAGSELKDLEPFHEEILRATGVDLQFTYSGTLDGVERLVAGEAFDAAWFSHGKYLTLLEQGRIVTQDRIMLSPVVLGVKRSLADAWGWTNQPVTWQDVADKSAAGELHYAMTNPASSNSGFTALVGVAAAFSGSADALQSGEIPTEALKAFFKGQTLTAGSSGWLAESYLRDQDRLDGMINYESVLLSLNDNPELREKLELVYPQEGIITADYPVMLLNADKRAAFDRLVDYLRSAPFQEEVMTRTMRRPVNTEVALGSVFPTDLLVELPFPNSAEVVNQLVFSYLDEQRVPAHAFFVLDVSGSMEGERLSDLKRALVNLTGQDDSVTGQFARFLARERLTLMPFSDRLEDVRTFNISDPDAAGEDMTQIRTYTDNLVAGGGTAIFSTLEEAYERARRAQRQDPDRYYSIVVLSDGDNTEGVPLNGFLDYYRNLPEDAKAIKTFAVLFGAADAASMNAVAETTGGRVFDSRATALSQVFKQIRGYQ